MKFIQFATFLSFIISLSSLTFADSKIAEIISVDVIAKQDGRYIGWPSIAKTTDGLLVAVFSGDRDEHICPWGKTFMVKSADNGKTWSDPEIITSTPLDDRDAGIIVTKKGHWLVSWFTSLAFETYIKNYPDEITKSWKLHSSKLDTATKEKWLGSWVRTSPDNGKTWGNPVKVAVTAPHGPIELRDSSLLYVGRSFSDKNASISTLKSFDNGKTWTKTGSIPLFDGDDISLCHEPHAIELSDGTILAMYRYEPPDMNNRYMRQSFSHDGGKTWSKAEKTPILGYPPHLLMLKNGWIAVAYGRRIPPYGERVCISRDGGKTWDVENEIALCGAPNDDLGYPASVELGDGSILTVFYQQEKAGEKTCLMGVHWRLK